MAQFRISWCIYISSLWFVSIYSKLLKFCVLSFLNEIVLYKIYELYTQVSVEVGLSFDN
jgi:hypothetical protein